MVQHLILYVILAALVCASAVFYVRLIVTKMQTAFAAIGKPDLLNGLTGWPWLSTKLLGWRTHILLLLAGGWQLVSALLQSGLTDWAALPWASVFEGKTANYVTFGLAALASLTHAAGFQVAAKLPPQE